MPLLRFHPGKGYDPNRSAHRFPQSVRLSLLPIARLISGNTALSPFSPSRFLRI